MSALDKVMRDIRRERGRQQMLKAAGKIKLDCADPATPMEKSFLVMTEEYAESAIECNKIVEDGRLRYGALYVELVQTAAVCVAMCEALHERPQS